MILCSRARLRAAPASAQTPRRVRRGGRREQSPPARTQGSSRWLGRQAARAALFLTERLTLTRESARRAWRGAGADIASLSRWARLTLIAALAAMLAACGGGVARAPGPAPSADPSRAAAAAFDQELRATAPVIFDGRLNAYIDDIVSRLRPPGARPVRVRIIAGREPYAITTGDFVYVSTSLMRLMTNEAQLAMVLAHEIAHGDLNHIAQTRAALESAKNAGLAAQQAIAAERGGDPDGVVARLGGELVSLAAFTRFSREKELEADLIGLRILAAAGYDPLAGASAIARFADMEDEDATIPWLSTHPLNSERMAALMELARMLQARGATDGFVGREIYERRALARLR